MPGRERERPRRWPRREREIAPARPRSLASTRGSRRRQCQRESALPTVPARRTDGRDRVRHRRRCAVDGMTGAQTRTVVAGRMTGSVVGLDAVHDDRVTGARRRQPRRRSARREPLGALRRAPAGRRSIHVRPKPGALWLPAARVDAPRGARRPDASRAIGKRRASDVCVGRRRPAARVLATSGRSRPGPRRARPVHVSYVPDRRGGIRRSTAPCHRSASPRRLPACSGCGAGAPDAAAHEPAALHAPMQGGWAVRPRSPASRPRTHRRARTVPGYGSRRPS